MTSGLSLTGQGLRKSFKKSGFSLDIDHLEVAAGEVLALLGPSGSGKSTLLRILGLLERPDSGTIALDGRVVTIRDRDARLKMAAVFQRPYLFKGSVGANVAYGLAAHGVPAAQRKGRVVAALRRVGLGGWEERSALSLSGGEAQRVSLARALVLEPQALLLDEPLASLDPLLKERMTRDFASIMRDAGVTVVYVTHDQDEAMIVADTVAVLNAGVVATCGPADDIMDLPSDDWTAAFLGVEAPLRGEVVRAGDGLVWIRCRGIEVAAVGSLIPGTQVLFGVRPEDVVLAEGDVGLLRTSARNRVTATVIEMASRGFSHHVVLDAAGARLASSVSRAAATDLGLQVGSQVTALFKATAVRVRSLPRAG